MIGIVGAVLGGWLAGAFFRETEGVDWLASIGVAMLLILLVRSGPDAGPGGSRPCRSLVTVGTL